MKRIYTIIITITIFLLLSSAAYSQTELAPALISPANNSKYNKTVKLTLQWIKVPGFDTYQLQLSRDESFQPEFIITDLIWTGNTVSAPELENLTEYYWRVRVDGDNPWSEIFKFTTTGFAVPVLLMQPPDGSNNIDDNTLFTWSFDSLNYSYNLQLSTDVEFSDLVKDITTKDESFPVSSLPKGSTIYWRVKSFNIDGIPADWSETNSFRSRLRTPRLVFPGNFGNNIDTDFTFRWNSVDLAGIYDFELSTNEAFEESSIILRAETTETRIAVDSLDYGQLYFWRVLARNTFSDSSSWSEPYRFKTELISPDLLAPADSKNNQGTSVKFNWSSVSDASYFKFQVSPDSVFRFGTETRIVEDTSYSFSGLENNSYYFWRVNSRNSAGDTSRWSETSSLKTRLATPEILSPADNSVIPAGSIIVEWEKIEGADLYTLQLTSNNDFSSGDIDTVLSDNLFLIDSLEGDSTFSLRVLAFNGMADSSSFSDTTNFSTSNFIAEPSAIDTVINYSGTPSEKVGEINLYNPSADQLIFKLISAEPADTFGTDKTELTLPPLSSASFNVLINTAVIDTGIFTGRLNLITEDDVSSSIPVNVYSRIATSSIVTDTLRIDTTDNDDLSIEKFYLSNPYGNIGLKIFEYRFTGNQLNSFKVINEVEVISPQDSSRIDIMFKPSASGRNEALLEMVTNGYPDSLVRLPLVGYGKGNFDPVLNDTLSFETTSSTSSSIEEFYLRNFNGHLELEISDYIISGIDTLAFEVLSQPEKISPQDSARIRVRFKPTALGSNSAALEIKTNSLSDSVVTVTLSGDGKGGLFAESTLESLELISGSRFESLTGNNKNIILENSGNLPLELQTNFLNDYFRITNDDPQPLIVQPSDSLIISLQYITPNFDSLNMDSLRINHNGLNENPLVYYLEGGFDSTASSQVIVNDLIVNGEKFSGEDYLVGENTSINAYVDNELLDDKDNLDMRLNYFIGGPGSKTSAVKSSSGDYIIPFDDVNSNGLIFKGELFTKGTSYHKIDSVIIFDFVDVQVVLDKYETHEVQVINSVPASNPADADVNWVFLGFPFEEIIFDSLFSFFGGLNRMEDGEWIVYEYDEASANYFTAVNSPALEPMKGYFFAQSVIEEYLLWYTYSNAVATRKLTNNEIELQGNGWQTVSSPFTFDVELESSTVLYKYDTNSKSYRLTSIMRPGEGYFVPPGVDKLTMQTFGEYYPDLFPKVFADLGWFLKLNIQNHRKNEELLISAVDAGSFNKLNFDNTGKFGKAPEIVSDFEAFITQSEDDKKYQAVVGDQSAGSAWDIKIRSLKENNSITISSKLFGEIPESADYAILSGGKEIPEEELNMSLNRNQEFILKLITGSPEYVQSKIDEAVNNVPGQFTLKQNYPNPFNPTTTIEYTIPSVERNSVSLKNNETTYPASHNYAGTSRVVSTTLKIYDMLGREMETLVHEYQAPGNYSVTFDASGLASGVYYYRLKSGSFTESKKMLLLK